MHLRKKAFWIGFLFGTLGLCILVVLRQVFSFLAPFVYIFLLPSRLFGDLFTHGLVSGPMLIILYILTGTFYGLSASFLEEGWIRMKRRNTKTHRS